MCIRTSIIREYGWDCNSLTEDMEFSMKLLTHGLKTCWAHDAIVYDEKVTTMMASCKQRLRWAQGQFDCADRYIPKLFAAGIKQGNIVILDGILQVSQPYFLLLTTIYLVFSYINAYVRFIQIFYIKLCRCLYGKLSVLVNICSHLLCC